MARRFLSAIKLLTGSTPPAGTAGDTFFDTDTKTVQVHDGDAWVNSTVRATDGAIGGRVFTGDTAPTGPVAGDLWVDSTGFNSQSNILRWRETAVGGETSLSGLDDLGTTLSYIPGYELVHINGVLQIRGQDYVATTGTTITGLTALAASDVVDIIAHSNMVYGDYYTQSQADARYPNMNTMPISGFRNAAINGGMDVWQRSTSSTTNGAYNSVDRWWMYYNAGTATFSRESTVVPTGFQYALKVVQASATASMVIYQVIETANAIHFAGKTVTLSVYLASTAAITVNPDVSYTTSVDTAVGGSWTNITATPASWSVPSGSTYARYTTTLTVPSTAKSIRVGFGPASITSGTSFYLTGVQLEEGSTATPFEQRPIGTELALCQRYYQNIVTPNATTDFNGPVVRESTTAAQASVYLPVSMRTTPSLVGSYFGRCVFRDTSFNVTAGANSAIVISSSGPSSNWITLVITHDAVAGTFVFAEWDLLNTTTNLGLSAEL
jgi:hypothetical protein